MAFLLHQAITWTDVDLLSVGRFEQTSISMKLRSFTRNCIWNCMQMQVIYSDANLLMYQYRYKMPSSKWSTLGILDRVYTKKWFETNGEYIWCWGIVRPSLSYAKLSHYTKTKLV